MLSLGKLQQGFGHMVVMAAIAIVAVGGIGVYVMQQSHAATTTPFEYKGCRNIQYSQNSTYAGCVKDIQIILNGITAQYQNIAGLGGGISARYIATDGYFGPNTKDRVKQFQRSARNAPTPSLSVNVSGLAVDGIVGPHTWDALCRFGAQTGKGFTGSTQAYYVGGVRAAVAAGCIAESANHGGGH